MKSSLMVNLFVLLLGLVVLVPSAYQIYKYCTFRFKGISVYGVIENPLQAKDLGGRPFVEFEDLQGDKHGFKTKAKTNWFLAPKKGEKIKIYYFENDPQTAIVDSLFHYLIFPLFFNIIGIMIVIQVFKNLWQNLNMKSE